jgi:hypothetical protein
MNPKAKTAILLVLPILIGGIDRIFSTAPTYVHAIALLLACALALVNLFHVPASVVDTITTLLSAVTKGETLGDAHPAVAAARATLRRARRVIPLVGVLAIALLWSPEAAVIVSTTGCNATSAQIGATILDGLKLAGCLLPQILSGITDPAQLLTCEGATEDLIIATVDDFTAQKPQPDGSLAAMADLQGITPQQRTYLVEARAKAATHKAARVGGK